MCKLPVETGILLLTIAAVRLHKSHLMHPFIVMSVDNLHLLIKLSTHVVSDHLVSSMFRTIFKNDKCKRVSDDISLFRTFYYVPRDLLAMSALQNDFSDNSYLATLISWFYLIWLLYFIRKYRD